MSDDDRGRSDNRQSGRQRGGSSRGGRRSGGYRRRYSPRRKVCAFCLEKTKVIDYKDVGTLRRFLTDRGKIRSRRKTGTCARHQRRLAIAVKRARHLALLPFTAEHIRRY
jgi:small subunit ribosomal protein S18